MNYKSKFLRFPIYGNQGNNKNLKKLTLKYNNLEK